MTYEFKTPLATISLAVDAIANPKILQNQDQIIKYAGIIRDENKRMHKQVEDVLQNVFIAKLRKYLKNDQRVEIINIHGNGFRLGVKK